MYTKESNKQFLRFVIVGIINTIFGYSVFAFFIFIGLHYTIAVLLSTIIGVLFNFKSIGLLVFNNRDNSLIFRFVFVYLIIYLLNVTGLWGLKKIGFDNMYINGFVLIFPLALISFLLNKHFVYEVKENVKEKN